MGAWGPAVFSNDTSSDVRDDFVDLIGDGLSAEQATERLQTDYGVDRPPDADPDLSADFWVALALTQHRLGRLLPNVRDAARTAATDPRELDRWSGPSRRKREEALVKAIERLDRPQPKARKVAKRVLHETALQPGQHVIYTLDSGRQVLLRVLSIHEDKGGR